MTNSQKRRAHRKTIITHRKFVRQMCWKFGLYWQGLVHDLSKYSRAEFKIYKYFDGSRSPHQVCREQIGYSPSWNHHYHRNKHHFQYWWDEDEYGKIIPIKMPYKYVIESVCDMIGAGRAYLKEKWTMKSPLEYWYAKCKGQRIMNDASLTLTENLLIAMSNFSTLEEFSKWYKKMKTVIKDVYENNIQDVFWNIPEIKKGQF